VTENHPKTPKTLAIQPPHVEVGLILPAIVFVILAGLGVAGWGVYVCVNRSTLAALLPVPLGAFCLVVGWKGRYLFAFRNTMACLTGDTLQYSNGQTGAVITIPLRDIVVTDEPWWQIAHIDSAITGERVMSIDYWYRDGMSLLSEIQRKLTDQGAAQASSEDTPPDEPSA
jgi:hypothetical protein